MFLTLVSGLLASDLAIDLGTANTVVYARGSGIVVHEPSVVAIREQQDGSRVPFSFGQAAKEMIGKTPEHVTTVHPVRDGVIADSDLVWLMMKHLIKQASKWRLRSRLRVVLCIPPSNSMIERRALVEPAEAAGVDDVYLVYEPLAAALGAGLDIGEPCGRMIVDIGGGTTDIAVISLEDLVYSKTLHLGGNTLDMAVSRMLRHKYQLEIGDQTAEWLKHTLGSLQARKPPQRMTIKGTDSVTGMPRAQEAISDDVQAALLGSIDPIIASIRDAFEVTPPELVADLIDNGITLTGGGALLHGLVPYLRAALGLPVSLAPDPMMCVALGAGCVLEQTDLCQRVAMRL